MTMVAVAASDLHWEVHRVTADGAVEHRWLDTATGASEWTGWRRSPFHGTAAALSALSGWDRQLEVFVLDVEGRVWNRWWWQDRGWSPVGGYNGLGRPFSDGARHISAVNAGQGHFTVFVEAADGKIAMLPHVVGPGGPHWRRCPHADSLGDGWWPAFAPGSGAAYRHEPTGGRP
ncbi:hypothetical protein [Amycolatopsis sp. Hca4]|uniref:hypothetical protein n=1 Tax=Amycolatopsis sp. Hca4 TaxID=2742131 RepID=UPI001592A4B1|nr:hypothetical protein [Amycolatopsis sp. Hca4]QKV80635.1 hypothetical protein HUT10_47810 [Amycolatopsis sp. Hca4]